MLGKNLKVSMNAWVDSQIKDRGLQQYVKKEYMDWVSYLYKVIAHVTFYLSEQEELFQKLFCWLFFEPGKFWCYRPECGTPLPCWLSLIAERRLWWELSKLQKYKQRFKNFPELIGSNFERLPNEEFSEDDFGWRETTPVGDKMWLSLEQEDLVTNFREYLEKQKNAIFLLFIYDLKVTGCKDTAVLEKLLLDERFVNEKRSSSWVMYWKKILVNHFCKYVENSGLKEKLGFSIKKRMNKRKTVVLENVS